MDNNEGGYHANVIGTCFDMCPPNERQKRLKESDVHRLEQPVLDGETLLQTMVKKFQRSSADHELQIAEELRPPETLLKTVEYIENRIMELDDDRLIKYLFIWDRYRMIAKDFTLQQSSLALTDTWIECHEHMARWFVFMDHDMKSYEDFVSNHGQQNGEQLNNMLKSLNTFYNRMTAPDISRAHQAEFLAYFILFQIGNGGEVTRFLRGVDGAVLCSPEVKAATAVWQAVKTNDITTFFNLLDKADLLQACLIHRYVAQMRTAAIKRMARSMHVSSKPSTPILIAFITSALRFETTEETIEFLEYCGYACDGNDEVVYLDGHSVDDAFPEDKNGRPIKPIAPPMTHMMEKKIRGRTIQQICHGAKAAALTTATLSLQERLKAARQKIHTPSSPAAPPTAIEKRKNELSSSSLLAMAGALGSNKSTPYAAQQQKQPGPFTATFNQQQQLSSNVPWPSAVAAPTLPASAAMTPQESGKLGVMFAGLSQQKQQSPQQQGKPKGPSSPTVTASSASQQQPLQVNASGKYVPPHQRVSPKPVSAVVAPSAPFQFNMPSSSQAQQQISKLSTDAPSFLPGKASTASSVAAPVSFAGFGQPLTKLGNVGIMPPPPVASFAPNILFNVENTGIDGKKAKVLSRQTSKAVAEPLSIPDPAPNTRTRSSSNTSNVVEPSTNKRQDSAGEKMVVPQPIMTRLSTEVSESLRAMVNHLEHLRAISRLPKLFRRWMLIIRNEQRQLVKSSKRRVFSSWKRIINEGQARRDAFMQSLSITAPPAEEFGMRIEAPSSSDDGGSVDLFGGSRTRGHGGRGQGQRQGKRSSAAVGGEFIITTTAAAAVDIPLTSFALSQAATQKLAQDGNDGQGSSRVVSVKVYSSSKASGLFSANDCPYTAILRAMFCNVHGLLSNFNAADLEGLSDDESVRAKQAMALWQCGKIQSKEEVRRTNVFNLAVERLSGHSHQSSAMKSNNQSEIGDLYVSVSEQCDSARHAVVTAAGDVNIIFLSSQQPHTHNQQLPPSLDNSVILMVLIVPCDDISKQSFSCHHIAGYPTMNNLQLVLGCTHDSISYQAACQLMSNFQQQLLSSLERGEDQLKDIILSTVQTLITTVPQHDDYETLPSNITLVDQIALPTLISRLQQSRPDVIDFGKLVAAQIVNGSIMLHHTSHSKRDDVREIGVFSAADWLLQDHDHNFAQTLQATLRDHLQALEDAALKEYSNWPVMTFALRPDCVEGIPNLCSVLSLPQLEVIGRVQLPYDWLTRSKAAITTLMKIVDAPRSKEHEMLIAIPLKSELIYLPKNQWMLWRRAIISLEGYRTMQQQKTVKMMILDWHTKQESEVLATKTVKKRRFKDNDHETNDHQQEKEYIVLTLPEKEKENSLAKRSRSLENEKADIITAVDELIALLKKETRRSQLTTNFIQSKLATH